MLRLATSERSSSISKLPQVVRSDGTGCAASHLLLANAFRSAQASLAVSRSAIANAAVGGSSAAAGAGAAVPASPVAAAVSVFWQPARAAATASDSSRTEGLLLIGEPRLEENPSDSSAAWPAPGVSEVTPGGLPSTGAARRGPRPPPRTPG